MGAAYIFLFSIILIVNNCYANFTTNHISNNSSIEKARDATPYIRKCCPFGEVVTVIRKKGKMCVPYDHIEKLPFADHTLYTYDLEPSEASLNASFNIIPAKFNTTTEYKEKYYHAPQFNKYLLKDGNLYLELPNAYLRWHLKTAEEYCIDYFIKNVTANTVPDFRYYIANNEEEEDTGEMNVAYLTGASLVSCVFLFLVLVVYSLLRELRNLCGKILMAYVASLFFAFLLLAIIQLANPDVEQCKGLTFSIYFFFLASFCWMNVMSYDIWWTFRGYAKARPIHRRGENFKFAMYAIYAWGLPMAMTIALAKLNDADLSAIPWFITPKIPFLGCFLEGYEKFLYLYVPMMILILCNWTFYLMTAYNVWRLSRGTAVLDSAAAGTPAAHRTHKYRFLLYLKLSVVMGLNWVLEVVSFLSPGFRVWNITDAYNILIGAAIFLIFVWKPNILRKLKKLFRRKTSSFYPPSMRSNSSTSDSGTSQETQTLQVCINPKGPGYPMKSM